MFCNELWARELLLSLYSFAQMIIIGFFLKSLYSSYLWYLECSSHLLSPFARVTLKCRFSGLGLLLAGTWCQMTGCLGHSSLTEEPWNWGGEQKKQSRGIWWMKTYSITMYCGAHSFGGNPVLCLRASPRGEFSNLLNFSWHVFMYDIFPAR